jgi:hypothetical protein
LRAIVLSLSTRAATAALCLSALGARRRTLRADWKHGAATGQTWVPVPGPNRPGPPRPARGPAPVQLFFASAEAAEEDVWGTGQGEEQGVSRVWTWREEPAGHGIQRDGGGGQWGV